MGSSFETFNSAGGFRYYDAVRGDKAMSEKSTLCGMDN